jgi:hypothetical protein
MRWKFETRDGRTVQSSNNKVSMRTVRFGLNYSFGRPPQSARRPDAPQQPDTDTQQQIR